MHYSNLLDTNSADDALQNDERHVAPQTVAKSPSVGLNIANATKTGYLFCKEKGIFDLSYPNSKLRRGRVQHLGDVSPTLTCNPDGLYVVETVSVDNDDRLQDLSLRHLTEREAFRLMGLSESEIEILTSTTTISRNAKYKLAGNSIVVPVFEEILSSLIFDNVKNSKKDNPDALY